MARLRSLDGLRAAAALAVFAHHVGFASGATFNSWAGGMLARLDIGVPIFFVLSGFLMFRPVVASVTHDGALRPAREHLWRRALRIYPAFWAALCLIVALTSERFVDYGAALSTFALVHAFWSDHVVGPMPHAWSLATEISFYALLPVAARLLRPAARGVGRARTGDERLAVMFAALAALYALSVFFRLWMHGLDGDWTRAALLWLPAMIDYFAIGMALAVADAGWGSGSRARRRLDRWARPAALWWLAAAALFVFVSEGLGLARGLAVASWPLEMARQGLYGVIGFALIFPLVFGGADQSAGRGHRSGVRRLMTAGPVVWLGTISYSFYLWHMVFIVHPWAPAQRAVDAVWDATVRTGWFEAAAGWTGVVSMLDSRFATLTVVAAVPTTAAAAASYLVFERAAKPLAGLVRGPRIEPTRLESCAAGVAMRWRSATFRVRLATVAAGAAVVRLCYVLGAKRSETLVEDSVFPGDQFYYALAGDALADGKGFVVPWHHISIAEGFAAAGSPAPHAADHPPLTALTAAFAGLLPGGPGSHVLEQRLTMAALGVAAVIVIGLLGRAVAGPKVGVAAAMLAAVHAGFWVNDGLVMSETLATLAAAGLLLAALRYWRCPSGRRALEMGAWTGAAALTRSEMLLLGVAVMATATWAAHPQRRQRLAGCAVATAAACALVAPWVIPNLVRFEEPVLLSTNSGVTLAGANNAQTYAGDAIGFWSLQAPEQDVDVAGLDQSERSAAYRDAAFEFALDNPRRWPAVIAARVGRVWSVYRPFQMIDWNQGEGRELWASMLAFGGYAVLVPVAAVGWTQLRRRGARPERLTGTVRGARRRAARRLAAAVGWTQLRRRGPVMPRALLALPLAHVTVVAAAFYGLARLRVTAEVALVVLAAVALAEWRPWRGPPDVSQAPEECSSKAIGVEPVRAPN